MRKTTGLYGLVAAVVLLAPILLFANVYADTTSPNGQVPSDFSIQVSPSPLVATVKPGQTANLDIQIRNNGSQTEHLKIEPRSFSIGKSNEEVKLNDTTPPDINSWLSFQPANFTIASGATLTEKVSIDVPSTAGFSYSFALIISRQKDQRAVESGRLIKGSLAIFTLLNVDRPGATRRLDVTEFSVDKHVYEYLPASFTVQFKNSGNSITQPFGNIFIERSGGGKPLDTLNLNDNRGYILPNTTRTLHTSWSRGFPVYQKTTQNDGTTTTKLTWDFSEADHFRFGKYTAKLAAIYNDGQRDVLVRGSVDFWVIPWRMIAVALLIVLVILFGVGTVIWKITRMTRRRAKRTAKLSDDHDRPSR